MRVLITGAAGGVGTLLVPELAADHELRLTDLRAPDPFGAATADGVAGGPVPGGAGAPRARRVEVVCGDLADPGFAEQVCAGMDAVVHLAGNPRPGKDWDTLRGPNIEVLTGVLVAAAKAGVRRMVLASSVHALGGYLPPSARPEPGPIRDSWPPHPCCGYGATKVFGEAAARVYADDGAFSVVCLRLGGCRPAPPTHGWFDTWLGPADLGQAVRRALRADVRFGAYTITSANTEALFDLDAARRDLGYAPVLDSETYRDSVPDGPSTLCHSGRS